MVRLRQQAYIWFFKESATHTTPNQHSVDGGVALYWIDRVISEEIESSFHHLRFARL